MKKNIFLLLIGAMMAFVACEPIEDRESLEPAISEGELSNNIQVTVTGNTIKCVCDHASIPYWETSNGKTAHGREVEFYMPLANTYSIKCTAFGGADKVSTTKSADIVNNDDEYYSSPLWNYLTNGRDGKTWVWATDKPGATTWGVGQWYNPGSVTGSYWWGQSFPDLAGQGCSTDDELYFDLNAAQNVSVTMSGAGARPGSGSGVFDMTTEPTFHWDGTTVYSYGTLSLTNQTIPIGFDPNGDGQPYVYDFEIVTLNENELVLAWLADGLDRTATDGGAWFFQFKRKGYSY